MVVSDAPPSGPKISTWRVIASMSLKHVAPAASAHRGIDQRPTPMPDRHEVRPNLAAALALQGHRVSARTVAKLLKDSGYSLQSNVKTVEGKQHPDRDAQFGYLNAQVSAFAD